MDKDALYREMLARAENDSDVIGFVLCGGRGKGMVTANSDYDIIIVAKDESKDEAVKKYERVNSTENIEAHVHALEEFRIYGNWGTSESWQGYNFAHLKARIDRTGEIQKLIDAKGRIPENEIKGFVNFWLGGFLNQHYRAFKNSRDGNSLAAHLDAVESIPMLLNVLFGREGRLRPYNKFLEWELNKHSLKNLPWPPDEFMVSIKKIASGGDIEIMKDFYRKIRDTSLHMGYKDAIADWDGYKLE